MVSLPRWTLSDCGRKRSALALRPTFQAFAHKLSDPGTCGRWGFVFPDPLYEPAGTAKQSIGVGIPSSIRSEFLKPPLCVRFGARSMTWTRVPEAAIDKDDHSGVDKKNVGSSAPSWKNLSIDPETQSPSVKNLTKGDLGRGVALTSRLHSPESLRRGRRWRSWPAQACFRARNVAAESPRTICVPSATIRSGGTAFPIIFARAPRPVSSPKSNQSGNVWSLAAS